MVGQISGVEADEVGFWGWDSMVEAMKKSETFGAPSQDIQNEAGIEFVEGSHGSSGPLHYSYPGLYVLYFSYSLISLILYFYFTLARSRK